MPSSTSTKYLKVLNASAGSGKTHNLVLEYLTLVLENDDSSSKFSSIIAMTFTNMAALEMKNRMIQSLDKIAHFNSKDEKTAQMVEELTTRLGLKKEVIIHRANQTLKWVLHRYEDFYVVTIDKFNLRLIRSFARDLDLPADFEVVLNEKQLIGKVVDQLMNNLGKEEQEEFTTIAFEYAKRNLEDGVSWDFRRQLSEFGEVLNKEKDLKIVDHLLTKDFSPATYKQLQSEVNAVEQEFKKKARDLFDSFIQAGVDSSQYPQGKSLTNSFFTLKDLDELPSKLGVYISELCFKDTPAKKDFPESVKESNRQLVTYFQEVHPQYELTKKYLKSFYNMALLKFIAKSINSLKKEERLIRISEFNQLISSLVLQEEAPFIYERLGSRFQHFLLDEFQDTSRLQWINLVPLVHESMGNQHKNLIVGDPKQSIYRFKNGVAEQFLALPGIYNPEHDPNLEEKSDYFREMGEVIPLNENWRSGSEIVSLNNEFFESLREDLPSISDGFYDSVSQTPRAKHDGLVQIESYKISKDQKIDIEDKVLKVISDCLEDGFEKGDICILTERNAEANHWAVFLRKNKHKVVSAESLLLNNDPYVQTTLSYFKRRYKPFSTVEIKKFADLFLKCKDPSPFDTYRTFIKKGISKEGKEYSYFDDDEFIANYFGDRSNFFFKYESLYELTQEFFRIMGWNELNNPYLHHLSDFVYDLEINNGPDLELLLSTFDEKKNSLAIQTPASRDAIVIMTMHKSKGLEFPVVIIPNMALKIKNGKNTLVEVGDKVLYTPLSKESVIDEVKQISELENGQALTDKFNLCYVAMTRPEERLYGFNQTVSSSIGQYLHDHFNKMSDARIEENKCFVQRGTRSQKVSKEHKKDTFFTPDTVSDQLWFPDIALRDNQIQEETLSEEQRYGNQFHWFMAEMDPRKDVSEQLSAFLSTGKIEKRFKERIFEEAVQLLHSEEWKNLFSHESEILNEREIIISEEEMKRPDKIILQKNKTIVLDYKTGVPNEKNKKQIRQYAYLLDQMGFPNVKGYLYYTNEQKLVPVD